MSFNINIRRRSTFKMNNKLLPDFRSLLIAHLVLFVNIMCNSLDPSVSSRDLIPELDTNKVLDLSVEYDEDFNKLVSSNSDPIDSCPPSSHDHLSEDFDSLRLLTNSSEARLIRVKKQIYAPPYAANGQGYQNYQNPQGQVSYVNPQPSYRQNQQGDWLLGGCAHDRLFIGATERICQHMITKRPTFNLTVCALCRVEKKNR